MEQEPRYPRAVPTRETNGGQESRRHVPAKSLGIDLPPGYHVLETRFRLILYFGDAEVRAYPIGNDPWQIERDAMRHAARHRPPRESTAAPTPEPAEDQVTGLPWTHGVTSEAAKMAAEADLHVVCVHLTGLDTLIDAQGYRASQAVLHLAARALQTLVQASDRLARHSGDKFLIFTTRPLLEVESLVEKIHREIDIVAATAGTNGLPRSQIGVASLPQETNQSEAGALIEALVISAEAASSIIDEPAVLEEASEAHETTFDLQAPPTTEPLATAYPPIEAVVTSTEPAPQAPSVVHEQGLAASLAARPEAQPTGPVQMQASSVPPKSSTPQGISYNPPATTPQPRVEGVTSAPQPGATPTYQAAVEETLFTDGARRLVLKQVVLDISGQVATAIVELTLGSRRVSERAVGRDNEDRRLLLVAEAAARAITEFLPRGHGVVVHTIQHAPAEVGVAIWSLLFLLTPTGEQSLLGIAPGRGDLPEAAVNSVLNALNRRIGALLSESN